MICDWAWGSLSRAPTVRTGGRSRARLGPTDPKSRPLALSNPLCAQVRDAEKQGLPRSGDSAPRVSDPLAYALSWLCAAGFWNRMLNPIGACTCCVALVLSLAGAWTDFEPDSLAFSVLVRAKPSEIHPDTELSKHPSFAIRASIGISKHPSAVPPTQSGIPARNEPGSRFFLARGRGATPPCRDPNPWSLRRVPCRPPRASHPPRCPRGRGP